MGDVQLPSKSGSSSIECRERHVSLRADEEKVQISDMGAAQNEVGNSLVRVRKAYAIVDELMGSPLGDSVQQHCRLTGSARIRCDPVVAGDPYET